MDTETIQLVTVLAFLFGGAVVLAGINWVSEKIKDRMRGLNFKDPGDG